MPNTPEMPKRLSNWKNVGEGDGPLDGLKQTATIILATGTAAGIGAGFVYYVLPHMYELIQSLPPVIIR